MDVRKSRAGLAVEAGGATVGLRAGAFAVVAGNAEGLIDEQDVRCLTQPLGHQEGDQVARLGLARHPGVLRQASAHGGLHLLAERRIARHQLMEGVGVQADGLGRDRGSHGGAAGRPAHQPHLADVVAGCHIGDHHFPAAQVPGHGYRTAADQMQTVGCLAFGKDRLPGLVAPQPGLFGHRLQVGVARLGREARLDCPDDEMLVNHPADTIHRADQLVDFATR